MTPLMAMVGAAGTRLPASYSDQIAFGLHMNGENDGLVFSDVKGKAVVRNGDVKTKTALKKFGNASAFFDGTGDFLSVAPHPDFNFGTGDFTLEAWVYRTAAPATDGDGASAGIIFSFDTGAGGGNVLQLVMYNNTLLLLANSQSIYAVGTLASAWEQNRWYHVAATREAGTIRIFLDGALIGTLTNSATDDVIPAEQRTLKIGGRSYSNPVYNWMFTGYIDDVRMMRGVSLYNAAFTPPAAPFTDPYPDAYSSSVALLLHGDFVTTSTNVRDTSLSNRVASLYGDARLEATQSKFGGASLYFDGAGDYLTYPHSADFSITGDFTIEVWARLSLNNTLKYIARKGSGAFTSGFVFAINATGKLLFGAVGPSDEVGNICTGATTLTTGAWHNLAATKQGDVVRVFVNGVLDGLITLAASVSDNSDLLHIGRDPANTGRDFSGYLDEVRITTGYARYVNTFAPQAGPFMDPT